MPPVFPSRRHRRHIFLKNSRSRQTTQSARPASHDLRRWCRVLTSVFRKLSPAVVGEGLRNALLLYHEHRQGTSRQMHHLVTHKNVGHLR